MKKTSAIVIFDVGKTNKKLLLFDEQYNIVFEECVQLAETMDEDDFSCEDVHALAGWMKDSFSKILHDERFDVKAVNFSGYGASFVYLDKEGNVVAPLYNYLKPYSKQLQDKFYKTYGGESKLSKETASPVLGSLNSGMQLYRLKYERPEIFAQIHTALHLPQYLAYIISNCVSTDITSVGCHTNLWNFRTHKYHSWVKREELEKLFAPLSSCASVVPASFQGHHFFAGSGLHDSSAALIPYLYCFSKPFVLLSTGTWCISLNPFNHSLLSDFELHQDCLCYLSYEGKQVKASRLFAGYEHEQQVKRIARHFEKPSDYYTGLKYDEQLHQKISYGKKSAEKPASAMVGASFFASRDLHQFESYQEAYHCLIADIIFQQTHSTRLVLNDAPVDNLYVDGGFAKNVLYMKMLAQSLPGIEVSASEISQASALGAALAVHSAWNKKSPGKRIIRLKPVS